MKLCFLGESHAAVTLKEAARRKGFEITLFIREADLVFVSEDTPTNDAGVRDLTSIRAWIRDAHEVSDAPIIVTSQVPPGFMRGLGNVGIIHQAETLRMEDAMQRALYPEMLIVGLPTDMWPIPPKYLAYLEAFDAPILKMDYESAEFAKMAINWFLIRQVDTTNVLSAAAQKAGANWRHVARVLRHDSRIGPYAYLTPGDPLASKHLLRDWVTLQSLT